MQVNSLKWNKDLRLCWQLLWWGLSISKDMRRLKLISPDFAWATFGHKHDEFLSPRSLCWLKARLSRSRSHVAREASVSVLSSDDIPSNNSSAVTQYLHHLISEVNENTIRGMKYAFTILKLTMVANWENVGLPHRSQPLNPDAKIFLKA